MTTSSCNRSFKHLQGFTLIEILVGMTIILLLAGILLPALFVARRKGQVGSDITEMHQIGLAESLYHDDYGHFPGGCPDLVKSGNLQNNMCGALSDPFGIGASNYMLETLGGTENRTLVTSFKNSYVGLEDFRLAPEKLLLRPNAANLGWLVLATKFEVAPAWQPRIGSVYHRLLFDTSVKTTRVEGTSVFYQGRHARRWTVTSLFYDKG